jgi:hypothetical protein
MEYRVPDRNLFAKAARIALDVGTFGAADCYLLLGGENDNDGSAGCVAAILAGINAFIVARKTANPNCVVLFALVRRRG